MGTNIRHKIIIRVRYQIIILLYILCAGHSTSLAQVSNIYEYDNLSRLTKVQYPNGSVITYTYDALGNRLTKTRVLGIPAVFTIQNTSIPAGQNACYNATQTITLAGGTTTFTVSAMANVTLIAGQNIRMLPGVKVYPGGYLHGMIRVGGPWCNTVKSGEQELLQAGNETGLLPAPGNSSRLFSVWPNPATSKIHVILNPDPPCNCSDGQIFNVFGETVKKFGFDCNNTAEVSLEELPVGLYIIRVTCGRMMNVAKVIRQ